MVIEIVNKPDIVITTQDMYKEELKITKNDNEIEFEAFVDGCSQIWKLPIGMMKELVE